MFDTSGIHASAGDSSLAPMPMMKWFVHTPQNLFYGEWSSGKDLMRMELVRQLYAQSLDNHPYHPLEKCALTWKQSYQYSIVDSRRTCLTYFEIIGDWYLEFGEDWEYGRFVQHGKLFIDNRGFIRSPGKVTLVVDRGYIAGIGHSLQRTRYIPFCCKLTLTHCLT